MRFLHISDLHIGKRVHEISMLEDQRYLLDQILNLATAHKTDGILIAGDIYDKSIPSAEGVTLFDEFLTRLNHLGQQVFIISGNHDSSERLDFGGRLMEQIKVYIAGSFGGTLKKVILEDSFGPLNIYLLPFIKPAWAARYYDGIETYQDALAAVIGQAAVDTRERNLLLAHQFVTNSGRLPDTCESETLSIGGLDNVDCSVLEPFDYVALGHLHGPQRVGRDTIRYSGSPLKYSFSEALHKKSAVLVELMDKGEIKTQLLPLAPRRDMRKMKGPIAALLDPKNYEQTDVNDYIHATLTDEDEIYDAIGQLRFIYPNIMRLEFENSRTRNADGNLAPIELEAKSPMNLFEDFFQVQNNVALKKEQKKILTDLLHSLGGDKS